METDDTEPYNNNIERTGMDDYNTNITEMDATSQTDITQENKTATQAKSQEWTAITQATQRITMFRTLKQWDNTRTPMTIIIYPSKKNRL